MHLKCGLLARPPCVWWVVIRQDAISAILSTLRPATAATSTDPRSYPLTGAGMEYCPQTRLMRNLNQGGYCRDHPQLCTGTGPVLSKMCSRSRSYHLQFQLLTPSLPGSQRMLWEPQYQELKNAKCVWWQWEVFTQCQHSQSSNVSRLFICYLATLICCDGNVSGMYRD